jgi:hypothetical protein
MVYIVSHTWPNRWTAAGRKNGIVVYSNCDEVELFNDVRSGSFGKKRRKGVGDHFQWDDVNIQFNVLYAVGYVNGKEVAQDYIVLNHLPQSPHFDEFFGEAKNITASQPGYNYLYRVNCGGNDFTDQNGNLWAADREKINSSEWGSVSWANQFPGIPSFFASQRRISDPVGGTKDWKLFQTFRYGREKLKFCFPLRDGEYLVELYFAEPWWGTGGSMDCRGWRKFDVAINDKIVLKDLDIWKEVGHTTALKKIIKTKITGGEMVVSFPFVSSGQAVISAIAIASLDKRLRPAPPSDPILKMKNSSIGKWSNQYWLDEGDKQFRDDEISFSSLPPELFGAEWIKTSKNNDVPFPTIEITRDAELFIALDSSASKPSWLNQYMDTRTTIQTENDIHYSVYKKRFNKGELLKLGMINNRFLVMANPASHIEPAYDLKAVSNYKAVQAKISGPLISKGKVDGKERVIFNGPSANNILQWEFDIGVADMYSLTISYNNASAENIKGQLELLSADGTGLRTEEIIFTPTKPGKSNYINSTTGSMINAGKYFLRLRSKYAKDLSITSLDVQ